MRSWKGKREARSTAEQSRPSGLRGAGHATSWAEARKEGKGGAAGPIPGWAEKVGRKIFQIKIFFFFS